MGIERPLVFFRRGYDCFDCILIILTFKLVSIVADDHGQWTQMQRRYTI